MALHKFIGSTLFYVASILLVGCNRPATAPKMVVDPSKATDAAFEMYDENKDQILSSEELKACPSLSASLKSIDKDGSKSISQDELRNRIEAQVNSSTRLVRFPIKVSLNDRPLDGATVTAVPESFMGSDAKEATGETLGGGIAWIILKDDSVPDELKKLGLMQLGFYRLEVTHPTENIPAEYNTKTKIGVEVTETSDERQFQIRIKR